MLVFFMLPHVSWGVSSLQGFAQVEWRHHKKIYRFDQAILIKNDHQAVFESLDDFGNRIFKFKLSDQHIILQEGLSLVENVSKKRFNKILSLPLSQSELIHYFLYKIPSQVDHLFPEYLVDGTLAAVSKVKVKKKYRYKVFFKDFIKINNQNYPKTIIIQARQTTLQIKWREVKIW